MPSLRRKNRRRDWHDGHLRQLSCGHDHFRDAWGSLCDLPGDRREGWPGEAVLEDMQLCYRLRRGELLARREERRRLNRCNDDDQRPMFCELVFDQNMTPIDALRRLAEMNRDYDLRHRERNKFNS